MDNLYWFDQIQSTDRPLVGEKAFYLSTLLQRGYPVVNGFVVTAPSFRKFLETINWSEPLGLDLSHSSLHLDVDNPRQLQRVSQKIRQEIMAAALPTSWISELHSAVETIFENESQAFTQQVVQRQSVGRALGSNDSEKSTPTTALLQFSPSIALHQLAASSLTLPERLISLHPASKMGEQKMFPTAGDQHRGIGDSLLLPLSLLSQNRLYETHICSPELEALALCLKQTWAELFRARSLFYWQRASIELQQLNLAVIVQPIWQCVACGTLESDTTGFSIQATWGLSHALSKGEVIPDSFRVHPESGVVQSQQLGSKTFAYGLAGQSSVHISSYELPSPQEYGNAYNSDKHVSANSSSEFMIDGLRPELHGNEPSIINNQQRSDLNDYLQAYLLGEEQQKHYAMEEKHLLQLSELAQRLKVELGTVFSLEWTRSLTGESLEPCLYLTQITQLRGVSDVARGALRAGASSFTPPIPSVERGEEIFPLPIGKHETMGNQKEEQLIRGLAAASGRTTAKAQVISGFSKNLEAIPDGRVLVTKSVTPDWLPLLKRAAGVVAELGSMTSHAAIIARELGIPGVVGAAGATQLIKTGELVLVDGDQGVIYRVSSPSLANNQEPMTKDQGLRNHTKLPSSLLFSPTGAGEAEARIALMNATEYKHKQPIATQLLVNLSQPSNIERAAVLPVDGVGLLRSELMILEVLKNRHPIWWVQQGRQRELVQTLSEHICQFAKLFSPRPVFYRSLDLRSHEFQSLSGSTGAHPETNPMLGMRGTFSYLSDPTLFDLELSALSLVQQAGYTNIHLLLPFVRTVEEFSFCRSRAIAAGLTQYRQFQLWIMAEVPSVLFLLPDYVKAGVQGISIGTNDLTQLLLGVDRDQAQMAPVFDERHPAVLGAIHSIIQLAKTSGIPCSICGLAPGQFTELVDQLVLAGITSISVELDAVERTYHAIAQAEQRLLLKAARRQLSSH